MKKLLLVTSLLAVISCSHKNQQVRLDVFLEEKKSNFGNSVALDVAVLDDRMNKEIIGRKTFGDEKINISSEQNLVHYLQKLVNDSLAQKGFTKGKDKIVELRIESLHYEARRRFFIGTSKAEGSFRVTVSNVKTGEKFTKNFNLALKNKHFIAPLEATDSETINNLLQELIQDVLSDEALLKNLAS